MYVVYSTGAASGAAAQWFDREISSDTKQHTKQSIGKVRPLSLFAVAQSARLSPRRVVAALRRLPMHIYTLEVTWNVNIIICANPALS